MRQKPILPSLREKKRYLAFEVVSKDRISAFSQVSNAIWQSVLSLHGELGAGAMGPRVLAEKYNAEKQRGLIRVSHKWVDGLKGALALLSRIDKQPVIVRSIGASGILHKAEEKYIK